MITHGNSIEILAGNANKPLAEAIAAELGLSLSDAEVGKFSDGEISITLPKTVRGKDVFIIQSTSAPVNDNLMELLIMIDACKRASAGRITAVNRTERLVPEIRLRQSLLPIFLQPQVRTGF